MFIVSHKKGPQGDVLVISDKELVGTYFEEGTLQLDLTSKFYQGDERGIEGLEEEMRAARHLHLTGERIIALALRLGLVQEGRVLTIGGIQHAQVVNET